MKTKDVLSENEILLCPECGFEYTHLVDVEKYKSRGGRLSVILHFTCEDNHKFSYSFHQHEGNTFIK